CRCGSCRTDTRSSTPATPAHGKIVTKSKPSEKRRSFRSTSPRSVSLLLDDLVDLGGLVDRRRRIALRGVVLRDLAVVGHLGGRVLVADVLRRFGAADAHVEV